MRYWLEHGLIYVDLGIWVDGVAEKVDKLDDLGLWKLLDDAFA